MYIHIIIIITDMKNLNETTEILKGIEPNYDYSFMATIEMCEDFIWGYLYDMGLQCEKPILTTLGYLLIYEKVELEY